MVFRHGRIDQFVIEDDSFPREGLFHETVGGEEGLRRKNFAPETILVGCQNHAKRQGTQGPERRDGPGDEVELVQTVNLLVVGFPEDRPVAVDDE